MQENLSGTRNLKGPVVTPSNNSRQPVRKHLMESASFSDSKSTEASTSMSMDEFGAVHSAYVPSSSRAAEVSPQQS